MINQVDFDTSPMLVGEKREMVVFATSIVTVTIECFQRPPDPPELQACDECGSFSIPPQRPLTITAAAAAAGGYLELSLVTADGDRRVLRIQVEDEEVQSGSNDTFMMG